MDVDVDHRGTKAHTKLFIHWWATRRARSQTGDPGMVNPRPASLNSLQIECHRRIMDIIFAWQLLLGRVLPVFSLFACTATQRSFVLGRGARLCRHLADDNAEKFVVRLRTAAAQARLRCNNLLVLGERKLLMESFSVPSEGEELKRISASSGCKDSSSLQPRQLLLPSVKLWEQQTVSYMDFSSSISDSGGIG